MAAAEPPFWLSATIQMINLLIVISITTYLFYQIVRSQRMMTDVNKRIFYTAISFMTFNWLFALCVLIATVYNLVIYIVADRSITLSEYNVLNAIAMPLVLVQNYLLLIALFSRLST